MSFIIDKPYYARYKPAGYKLSIKDWVVLGECLWAWHYKVKRLWPNLKGVAKKIIKRCWSKFWFWWRYSCKKLPFSDIIIKIFGIPIISWRFYSPLNWDIWFLPKRNILYERKYRFGPAPSSEEENDVERFVSWVYACRIHCAIAEFDWWRMKFVDCGGAGGSRFGITLYQWFFHIGFDNLVAKAWAFDWSLRNLGYEHKTEIHGRLGRIWPAWYPKYRG